MGIVDIAEACFSKPMSEFSRLGGAVGIDGDDFVDWLRSVNVPTEAALGPASTNAAIRATTGGSLTWALRFLNPTSGRVGELAGRRWGYGRDDLRRAAADVDIVTHALLRSVVVEARRSQDPPSLPRGQRLEEICSEPLIALVLRRAHRLSSERGTVERATTRAALLRAAITLECDPGSRLYFNGVGLGPSRLGNPALPLQEDRGETTVRLDEQQVPISHATARLLVAAGQLARLSRCRIDAARLFLADLLLPGTVLLPKGADLPGGLNLALAYLLAARPPGVEALELEAIVDWGDGRWGGSSSAPIDAAPAAALRGLVRSRILGDDQPGATERLYSALGHLALEPQLLDGLRDFATGAGLSGRSQRAGLRIDQGKDVEPVELRVDCLADLEDFIIDKAASAVAGPSAGSVHARIAYAAVELGTDCLRRAAANGASAAGGLVTAGDGTGVVCTLSPDSLVKELLESARSLEADQAALNGYLALRELTASIGGARLADAQWIARVGASFETVAAIAARSGDWQTLARATVAAARDRMRASGLDGGLPAWRQRSSLPLTDFDLRSVTHPIVVFAVSGQVAGAAWGGAGEEWHGTVGSESPDSVLGEWWSDYLGQARAKRDSLDTLLELFGFESAADVSAIADAIAGDDGIVHLLAGPRAAALPLAQALERHLPASVGVVVHVGGGLPSAGVSGPPLPPDGQRCLVVGNPSSIVATRVVQGNLVFGEYEALSIAQLLDARITLIGSQASRAAIGRVVDAVENGLEVTCWHFSCHGTLSPLADGTLAAGLVLARNELLAASDVLRGAGGDVIVCSACDIGVLPATDDALSWPVAAIAGGADWVVAAPWPVDDFLTCVFMKDLYSTWTNERCGLDLAVAAASRRLLECGEENLRAEFEQVLSSEDWLRWRPSLDLSEPLGFALYTV